MSVIKKLKLFAILAGFVFLPACATINYGTVVDQSIVTIERQSSRIADIAQVNIFKQKEGFLIRGKIRRTHFGRSHITGHLDIELINKNNKVTFNTSSRYQHKGLRFNNEDFSLIINKAIEKGSRLRITHVDSEKHNH